VVSTPVESTQSENPVTRHRDRGRVTSNKITYVPPAIQ
jgi:hypothetical protein